MKLTPEIGKNTATIGFSYYTILDIRELKLAIRMIG